MIRGWLVDTQLVIDWFLWDLANHPHRPVARAAQALSVLKLRTDIDAFERHLDPSRVRVLLSASVFAEAANRLYAKLSNPHRGGEDRVNEHMVRACLRFTGHFNPVSVTVTEAEAEKAMRKLNSENEKLEKRIDLGDAALFAALGEERMLLTADEPFFRRCSRLGRGDVFLFSKGEVRDAKGQPLRDRR